MADYTDLRIIFKNANGEIKDEFFDLLEEPGMNITWKVINGDKVYPISGVIYGWFKHINKYSQVEFYIGDIGPHQLRFQRNIYGIATNINWLQNSIWRTFWKNYKEEWLFTISHRPMPKPH